MDPDSLFSGFEAMDGYGPKTEKKNSLDPFSCSKALCKRIFVPYHVHETAVLYDGFAHVSTINLTWLLPL